MTSLTYAPDHDYNGPDSFTYTIADRAALTATGTVTITVTPINDPPTANPDTYTLDLTTGRTLTIRAPGVILNDVDVDGDRLTAVHDTSPANGTLTFNSDGSFTYVSRGIRGPDQFTYHAVDPSGAPSNVVPVIIQVVLAVPQLPAQPPSNPNPPPPPPPVTVPLPTAPGGSGTVTVPVTGIGTRTASGYVADGTVFFDANLNGVRDFLDANGTGWPIRTNRLSRPPSPTRPVTHHSSFQTRSM